MSTLEDAYNVLDLQPGASLLEVVSRYQQIKNEQLRPSGRRRTNMPAVDHSLKMIISSYQTHDEVTYDDDDDDDDDEEFFDGCSDYYYGTQDYYDFPELRENKFSRTRARADEGYSVNTDQEAVEASAARLLQEEADRHRNDQTQAKQKKKKKKKKKSKNSPNHVNNSTTNVNNNNTDTQNENELSSDSDGEGLDLNSAFAKAAVKQSKASGGASIESRRPSIRLATGEGFAVGSVPPQPPVSSQRIEGRSQRLEASSQREARLLAVTGNRLAGRGEYTMAADVFSQAIRLDPDEHRFLGNRSFCYERLKQYDRALKDAERAIQLDPDWPKGHFRKGRALLGRREYQEAEEAFQQVLRLDNNVAEAVRELEKIHVYRLMLMGFQKERARAAIRQYKTQEAALDALLQEAELVHPDNSSDSEDDTGEPTTGGPVDPKEDPSNVQGLRSIWVGNVMPGVTERELHTLFARHGAVTSVRLLPDRFCAFINFVNKQGASLAMQNLQGYFFHGKLLKIKFPNNPVTEGQPSVVLRKPYPTVAAAAPVAGVAATTKKTGSVSDGECYFWRTSECLFGAACRYKHIPASKGIDRRQGRRY